jgi:hypothetical protein
VGSAAPSTLESDRRLRERSTLERPTLERPTPERPTLESEIDA